MAKLEIPIRVFWDDVESMVEEVKSLQTYKLAEDDDMLLVSRDDIVEVMVRHVKAEKGAKG